MKKKLVLIGGGQVQVRTAEPGHRDGRDRLRCRGCGGLVLRLLGRLVEEGVRRRGAGGIEIALWDIRGKAWDKPLYELLGGAVREEIPFTEYFCFRVEKDGRGGEITPEAAEACDRLLRSGIPVNNQSIPSEGVVPYIFTCTSIKEQTRACV